MSSFFDALTSEIPLIRNALIAGLIASASFGVVGTYVVARRITYIAASIAHSALGGIGAAIYLQRAHGIAWLNPIVGALIAAFLSALIIGLVTLYANEREDSVIGAIWSVGMAAGLLFIHFTPPPPVDVMSYFFGSILIVSNAELAITATLGVVAIGIGLFYYNKLVATCFDEEFALLRGVNTTGYYLLLLALTAVSVVLLVKLVGIVLAIALLTLPAAIASRFANRLWQMMLIAILISGALTGGGLALSYQLNTPTGPTVIIIAAIVYLAVLAGEKLRAPRAE